MNLEYDHRNWKFPRLKFLKNPTSMKKKKIETKYMNLGWFSMLAANQVSVLMSLVVNVQHSVEVGVWPCQSSSKWWRLWGVLWDFGATQESLSQELGQGRTCSTLPPSLSMLPRKSRGFNSSTRIPAGKCFRWGGGRGMKPSVQGLHELRWENQASLTPSGITVEDHVSFQKAGPELQWSFHLGFIQSQRASSSFMRWCN